MHMKKWHVTTSPRNHHLRPMGKAPANDIPPLSFFCRWGFSSVSSFIASKIQRWKMGKQWTFMGLMDKWIALREARTSRYVDLKQWFPVHCPLLAANQSTDETTNHVRIMFFCPFLASPLASWWRGWPKPSIHGAWGFSQAPQRWPSLCNIFCGS